MKVPIRTIVPVVCVVALFACNRDREREMGRDRGMGAGMMGENTDLSSPGRIGETTLTGAMAPVSNDAAIDRLVAARCERESACNNVGDGKHYATRDTCNVELRGKMRSELKASDCPGGVDGKQLDKCMESIRKESCDNPIDMVSRVVSCRTSDLCLRAR